ncbi:hypothetical protein JXM83_01270 [Candidatus Woesearchaeota archaeon]|nr:hypothetical protein [Candidatus Woesearchaeota archaeon]
MSVDSIVLSMSARGIDATYASFFKKVELEKRIKRFEKVEDVVKPVSFPATVILDIRQEEFKEDAVRSYRVYSYNKDGSMNYF